MIHTWVVWDMLQSLLLQFFLLLLAGTFTSTRKPFLARDGRPIQGKLLESHTAARTGLKSSHSAAGMRLQRFSSRGVRQVRMAADRGPFSLGCWGSEDRDGTRNPQNNFFFLPPLLHSAASAGGMVVFASPAMTSSSESNRCCTQRETDPS